MNESPLTPRQREVIDFLCRGSTVKETAITMHISRRTVEQHAVNIKNRLGARNMVHAVAILFRDPEP